MKNLKELINGAGITPDELNEFIQAKKQKEEEKWINLLEKDSKGNYLLSPQNYMIYFNECPEYKGKLAYNVIKRKKVYNNRDFNDFDFELLYNQSYNFFKHGHKYHCTSALAQIFSENRYNPIKDYLDSLRWDGKPRMETLFIDWLGAEDNVLNREMTKKWLLAAVKRVIQPGCQFDNMIILQCADGGGGKTTLVKRLALDFGDGKENYYNELTGFDIDNQKNTVEILNDSWIVSFDELSGLNKKDVNNIKTFLSRTCEKVRKAYAKETEANYRHCVFVGSTNESSILKDYTSSVERRFWIIPITRNFQTNIVWNGFTKEIVDQIWAETYKMYLEDPHQALDIDYKLYLQLTEKQKKFKSYNNDVDIDAYKEVFNHEYILNNNGEINSYEIFEQQLLGTYPSNANSATSKMLVFPCQWVKQYMTRQKIDWKGPSYIAAACDMKYKVAKFNGTSMNCFVSPLKKDNRTNKQCEFTSDEVLKISGYDLFE